MAAFVVMPDHWHVLFDTGEKTFLTERMRAANRWINKSFLTEKIDLNCEWQEGFFDTKIRSWNQFLEKKEYIEQNPVRTKLVDCAVDWEWSSAHKQYQEYLTTPWPVSFDKE